MARRDEATPVTVNPTAQETRAVKEQTAKILGEEWDFSEAATVSIRRIKLEKTGDQFIGTYQGAREDLIADTDAMKAGNASAKKPLTLLLFDDPAGEPCELPSDYQLTRLFLDTRRIVAGDRVKVTRLEVLKLGGGRTMNQYEVLCLHSAK